LWQLSHEGVVGMCVGERPVAVVPLWQLAHVPVAPEWSNRAFAQVDVVWQSSQVLLDGTWFAGLPDASRPLWQLAHDAVTPV
jgi:hypothetical protein